jgi:hypothetical protein
MAAASLDSSTLLLVAIVISLLANTQSVAYRIWHMSQCLRLHTLSTR